MTDEDLDDIIDDEGDSDVPPLPMLKLKDQDTGEIETIGVLLESREIGPYTVWLAFQPDVETWKDTARDEHDDGHGVFWIVMRDTAQLGRTMKLGYVQMRASICFEDYHALTVEKIRFQFTLPDKGQA